MYERTVVAAAIPFKISNYVFASMRRVMYRRCRRCRRRIYKFGIFLGNWTPPTRTRWQSFVLFCIFFFLRQKIIIPNMYATIYALCGFMTFLHYKIDRGSHIRSHS
jgi:hypothetical protein